MNNNITQAEIQQWKAKAEELKTRGFILSEPCLRLINEHIKLVEVVARQGREAKFLRTEVDKLNARINEMVGRSRGK